MYKIISLLLIAFLFTGCNYEIVGDNVTGDFIVCNKPYIQVGKDCCLDKDDNGICDKDEVGEVDRLEEGNVIELPEEKEEEPEVREEVVKEEPEKLEKEKIVIMEEGDSVIFNGKEIKLIKIDSTSGKFEFVVNVEGVERSLYSTKNMEIVNGVKITALKVDNLKRTVEIKFELFELEINQYLIDTNKNIFVGGKEIRLRDVNKDEYILVDIIDSTLKTSIRESYSEVVDGLEIGNVDAFFRDALFERYAIINVTKV